MESNFRSHVGGYLCIFFWANNNNTIFLTHKKTIIYIYTYLYTYMRLLYIQVINNFEVVVELALSAALCSALSFLISFSRSSARRRAAAGGSSSSSSNH